MKKLSSLILAFLVLAAPLFSMVKTSALGPNLITNPSVETAGNPTTAPMAWQTNAWGTNSASFQYLNEGRTGNRSVKTTVTSYTDGDAKWFFNPLNISPNTSYTYSTYYKSGSTSEIVVQVKDAAGNPTYHWLKTVPVSAAWAQVSAEFVTPSNAATATVFHVVNNAGWLQIDDSYFGLTATSTPDPVAPVASITSPEANASVNGSLNVMATASSPGASVAGVQFKVNGNNLGAEDTTAPYSASWNTATVANGSHALTAVVRSTNGLSATSAAVNVNVNNPATPPPVDDENVVPNPSVETADPTNNQKPANWLSNKWGTNTGSFAYNQTGRTGNRSVTTQINAYTSGDAKWYFEPVNVTAGKTYLYRDYYKANVPSRVVVAFIDASGNYTYQEIDDASAANNWTQYQANFLVPSTAVKATVFHLIDRVGSLTIDDVLLQVATPPAADITVPNGSVELGTTTPTGWQNNKWGTNTANFQYVTNEGRTGNKSVKVTVSNYQNGDAKWFFTPINSLTPGKQYRFTNWYKTNVTPHAVAMFIDANGTESYFGLPAPKPNGTTEWQKYSDSFMVPQNAVSVSVFMYVSENGWLQTDDYSITDYHPNGFNRPLVTLTFDDGHEDNVNTALPIMNQYGFKSTQCYATTFAEGIPAATSNILAFKNAGHEICSHTVTHPFLTSLNPTDLNYELQHSKQYLESVIGEPVRNFASPYGDYNQTVINAIDDYYQSHRTVDEGFNSKDNFDIYRLRVQNILDTTSAAQVQAWIEQAQADNTWLILVYHRVANDPGPYDSYTNVFAQHMAAIQSSGITVKTYQDALTEVRSQL